MPSVLEKLRDLATSVAGSLPAAAELTSLSAADEAEATRLLGGIRSTVNTAISLLAADIERKSARDLGTDGLAQRNGFKDGAGFLQDLAGLRRDEAARLIRLGGLQEKAEAAAPTTGEAEDAAPIRSLEVLRAAPGAWDAPIAVALKRGWLTAAQADALCTALGNPRSAGFADAWRRAAIDVIGDCWEARFSPEDLARAAKRVRAALDTAAAAAEAQQRYEQRSLKRFVRSSGMVHYDIDLDPESDARFYGPIKQLLSPRFGGPRFTSEPDAQAADELETDPRTNEQLQVDTLVELMDRAVNCDEGRLFKNREPHVMVAVTTDELRKARDGQPGIAFIDGRDEPITSADALRMICTGGYTPILFDETGQTIDLGRDQRYFTHTQRRAIAKRDGSCVYPGCDRPPEDCEYHHINPWSEGPQNRKSETRDGVLLCRRHHKLLHDHHAAIRRTGGEYRLHWPGKPHVRLYSKSGIQAQLRAKRVPA